VPNDILITGGTGFIGSNLARQLLSSGHCVKVIGRRPQLNVGMPLQEQNLTVVQGDLCDQKLIEESLRNTEIIFHKASSYATLNKNNDRDLFHSNIRGTQALVDALKRTAHKVRKVIFDSSISVYGEGSYSCRNCGKVRPQLRTIVSVTREQDFDPRCPACRETIDPVETSEADSLNGISSYATSKKVQEELLQLASEQLGFSLTIFRYATVYGPGQRNNSPYARFLDALCRGELVTLNEDGLQKRDFIYVDDVVRANVLAMRINAKKSLTLNVGTGVETSIVDFVSQARDLIRSQFKIDPGAISIANILYDGDVRHCKIDCSNAKAELDFAAEVSWQRGLEHWVASYASDTEQRLTTPQV
jgi:dTDP-L-rhamnose 4-epimerase